MTAPSSSNPVDPKVAQALRRQRSKEAAAKARLRKEDELRALQAQVAQLRREKRSLQVALDEQCAHSQSVMERVTLLVARHKALATANVTLQSHLARAQELFPELLQHLPAVPPLDDPCYHSEADPNNPHSPRAPTPPHYHHHRQPHDDDPPQDPMAVDASDATESYSHAPTALTTAHGPPGLVIFSASAAPPRHATAAPAVPPAHSGASQDDYHHPHNNPTHSHHTHHAHHLHHQHPESPSPDPSTAAPTSAHTRSTGSAPVPPRANLRRPRAAPTPGAPSPFNPTGHRPSPFNPTGHRASYGRPTCSDSQDSAGATTTLQRQWSGTAPYPPDAPPPPHALCHLEAVASTSSYLTRPTPSPVQISHHPNDHPRHRPDPPPTLSLPSRIPHSTRHRDARPSPLHSAPADPSSHHRSPSPPSSHHHHHHNHRAPPSLTHMSDPYPPPSDPTFPYPPPSAYSNGSRGHTYPPSAAPLSQTSTDPSSYYQDDVTQDTHGTHDDYPPLNDPPSFNLSTLLTLSSIPLSMPPPAGPDTLPPPADSPPSASNGTHPPLAEPSLPPSDAYHHHPHHPRQPQTIYRSASHGIPSVNSLGDIPTLDPSDPYAPMPSVPTLQIFNSAPPAAPTPNPWPDAYDDPAEDNGNGHHPHRHHDDNPPSHYHHSHEEPPYHPSDPHSHNYPPAEYPPAEFGYAPHDDEHYPPQEDQGYPPHEAHMGPEGSEWGAPPSSQHPHQSQSPPPGMRPSSSRQASRLSNQRTRLQQLVWTTEQ